MKIKVDAAYRDQVIRARKYAKKYTPLFDTAQAKEFDFSLTEEGMRVRYKTEYDTKTVTYAYEDLKCCEVRTFGCILRFRDKKFLLLPVTEDEDSNDELIDIGLDFKARYDGFHFVACERLCLPDGERKKSKRKSRPRRARRGKKDTPVFEDDYRSRRVALDEGSSPIRTIVLALVSFVMATVFVMMPSSYGKVAREEALPFEGVYERYVQDSKDYIELYFTDGSMQTIHECCALENVVDAVDALETGERLYLLIHPDNEFVIEVRTEKGELLNIDESQRKMQTNAKLFRGLGIFVYCGGAYLIGYAIWQMTAERRYERSKKK